MLPKYSPFRSYAFTQTCLWCNRDFIATQLLRRRCCSRACLSAWQRAQAAVPKTCGHCGVTFTVRRSEAARIRFCSPTCRKAAKHARARHTAGYYHVKDQHGQLQQEHRVIVERVLGRKLRADELVHHKDGDKKNNSPSNLEVVSAGEHNRLHGRKPPRWARKPTDAWAVRYAACRDCGTAEREHVGFGYCINCYQRRRTHRLPLCHG